MEATANVDHSKTLNAGSATLIFLAFFFAPIPIVLIETMAGTSLSWLMDGILYPMFAWLGMVLAAVRLIPMEIKKVGPTGPAWVLGRWENLIKGLMVGCIIGVASRLWDVLNQAHVRHNAQFQNSQFVDPIYRALETPGAIQLLAIATLVLLVPAVEEMMFRGILYGGYRKSFGPISAALVTTVAFVAMHFDYYINAPYKIVCYIVGALALLWCRLRWNAIGPAIAAHGGFNTVVGVIPALFLMWQHGYYESGVTAYKTSNFKESIACLTRAIQLGDKSPNVYVYRGNAKYREADLDGAISDYSRAIELNPKDSNAFYDRGLAKDRKADFEGAIADYDKAITLNPKDSRAYSDRGVAKIGEEKFDEAIADISRAIELDRTNSSYYDDQAWAEFKKGDFGYAIADATRSIKLDPNFGYAYGTRAWARYKAGNTSGAVEDCKKAISLYHPGSAPFFYDHGLLDFIAKDYTQAIADWQNSIKRRPGFKKELQPWIEKAQELAGAKAPNSSSDVHQTEIAPAR
ncbi:MAG TPA: tetratricopeptide repeat protein [Verrucomicrobiae bacterium]|jgi:tetratricopeptide (TPR) repeat protein/membrane protease YdiL (CAAX protease family)|nr:tetratricopeptide repeat protein [Verrucomicrobiae bacterium]